MILRRFGVWSSVIGAVAWLAWIIRLRPGPFQAGWAVALLLLAPLVLVPLGLRLAADPLRNPKTWRVAVVLQLPAALLLAASFALPAGKAAAALSMPWLACTSLIALSFRRPRGTRSAGETCIEAGLLYVAVGGAWAVLWRLGARPLGFEEVIVLLTAIHFHYAGFVLPLLTGLAGRAAGGGPTSRLAAVGVVAGVPLVAAGITATQLGVPSLFECLTSWVLALAGLMAAWLHLRLAFRAADRRSFARVLMATAGLSLGSGSALAALYGARISGLDIPRMRAWHGTAMSLGFGLAGVLGWSLGHGADLNLQDGGINPSPGGRPRPSTP
jgi:hypothetical protein